MKDDEINLVRDAAILLEHENPDVARGLMLIAHNARPAGTVIADKLKQYNARFEQERSKLLSLVETGELAVIPAGFRCHTKANLFKTLGLAQASLPFDSGFFPPVSIANVLRKRKITLSTSETGGSAHHVCTKHEGVSRDGKLGIEFRSSNYKEIKEQVRSRDQVDINNFLDSTFGYYTLDTVNSFILAHYNWHNFSDVAYSNGVHDPVQNIQKINVMLNARIDRMFNLCSRAQNIIFVLGEFENFKFLAIDDVMHDLTDIVTIKDAIQDTFGRRAQVVRQQTIDSPSKLLSIIT